MKVAVACSLVLTTSLWNREKEREREIAGEEKKECDDAVWGWRSGHRVTWDELREEREQEWNGEIGRVGGREGGREGAREGRREGGKGGGKGGEREGKKEGATDE